MSEAILSIQKILKEIGSYDGKIDGLIGFKTYSSVLELKNNISKKANRDIQKILADNKLYSGEIDGIFGKGSITAFNNLLPAPTLTDASLKKIQSNCATGFADQINKYAIQYQIKTKADLCAFVANCIHETNGFNKLREDLNYSAKNLLKTFPKYFKTLETARALVAKGQIAIGDVIYGGRLGNGINNGDGFKYRGGGVIHLTGKRNYSLASIAIGAVKLLLEKPELITTSEYAIKTAMWFWKSNRCSTHANNAEFDQVCRIVNGGKNGLEERRKLHEKAWNILF